MFELPPLPYVFATVIVIFFAIGLHEYAHCKMADMCGDPTPRYYGRVTLNLFKHFEPLGTFMMIITSLTGVGIGWGKASPINPLRMRNPRWDAFASVLAGPVSNLIQAIMWAMMLRAMVILGFVGTQEVHQFFERTSTSIPVLLMMYGVLLNLGLMCFNLIPLGPLDGHWILGTFLPDHVRERWYLWNRTTGSFLLIAIIIVGQMSEFSLTHYLVGKPVFFLFHFLTGI